MCMQFNKFVKLEWDECMLSFQGILLQNRAKVNSDVVDVDADECTFIFRGCKGDKGFQIRFLVSKENVFISDLAVLKYGKGLRDKEGNVQLGTQAPFKSSLRRGK